MIHNFSIRVRPLLASALIGIVAVLFMSTSGQAQAPFGTGISAGWGGSAAVEARYGDAVLWNPALVNLPDAQHHRASISILGAYVEGATNVSGGAGVASSVIKGITDPYSFWSSSTEHLTDEGDGTAFMQHGLGSVAWLSGHMGQTGFAVTSGARYRAHVPGRVASLLAGDVVDPVSSSDVDFARSNPSDYHATTTFAVSRSTSLNRLPILGHTWLGIAGKYTMVHAYGAGVAHYGSARDIESGLHVGMVEDVIDEDAPSFRYDLTEIGGRVQAIDLGFVANPLPGLLIAANGVNLYQDARVGAGDIRIRQFWWLGGENGFVRPEHGSGAYEFNDISPEARDDLESHAARMHFTRLVRVAGSYDMQSARVSVAGGFPIGDEGGWGQESETRWGVSIASTGRAAPRVSYSSMLDGSSVISLGGAFKRASRTAHFGVNYRQGETKGLGVGFGFTFGGE